MCIGLQNCSYQRNLIGKAVLETSEVCPPPTCKCAQGKADEEGRQISGKWLCDGGIYIYPQKDFRVELCSVCRPFLEWVEETVERLIDLEASGLYRKAGEAWALTYFDSRARRLLERIYYASDLPCLERKRAVWEEYCHSSA